MTKLLTINDLWVEFNGEPVVKGISLSLEKGKTLALVGESGSGKSVTALSILQLLPYPSASHSKGTICLDGEILLDAEIDNQSKSKAKKEKRALLRAISGNRIAMIFQEPMTSLNPLHSIEKQIAEVLYIHKGIKQKQAQSRVIELLELVGIPDPEKRLSAYPHELSGGQRQRVMIAMALANEPDLLIADEPTTALDVTIQKQILSLLVSLQKKMGMAILLITHDLNVVRAYSDDVAVMKDGELVEQASCESLFTHPQHDYTKVLLDSEPSRFELDLNLPTINQTALLKCDNLKVWFPIKKGFLARTVDYVKAVDGISLSIQPGETVGIVGESGSGKSTLAQALLRLNDSEGTIEYRGIRLDSMNNKGMRRYRKDLQIVFQDPFGSLSPRMSVEQIIEEGLLILGTMNQVQRRSAVMSVLTEVGLEQDMMHRYPHEFSGGQRQRIAIARALVLKPRVLILDEPTSALDSTVQKQILTLLRTLQQKRGLTYLFISHDLAVIRALSHRVIVMKEGVMIEEGDTEELFSAPTHPYTKELLSAALL